MRVVTGRGGVLGSLGGRLATTAVARGSGSDTEAMPEGRPGKKAELMGVVTRSLYRGDGPTGSQFGVIVLDVKGTTVRVAGTGAGAVAEGDSVGVSGKWTQHPKYGMQVKSTRIRRAGAGPEGGAAAAPGAITAASMTSFLSSGAIKGVGPATARRIVEALGPQRALEVVTSDDWSALLAVRGVGQRSLERMRASWEAEGSSGRLSLQLHGMGMPLDVAAKAASSLGAAAAADILSGDPYDGVGRLAGMSLADADGVASMGLEGAVMADAARPSRVRAALRLALRQCVADGHTGLPGPALLAEGLRLLLGSPKAATKPGPGGLPTDLQSLGLPPRAEQRDGIVALASILARERIRAGPAPPARAGPGAEGGGGGGAEAATPTGDRRPLYAAAVEALSAMVGDNEVVWLPDEGSAGEGSAGPGSGEWWELRGRAFSLGAAATEDSLAVAAAVLRSGLGGAVAEAGSGTAMRAPPRLSDEQSLAVRASLESPLAVLCGGPGTGKTFATRAVVVEWLRRGLRVALACPTARAAHRLNEMLASEREAWGLELERARRGEADVPPGARAGLPFPRAVTLHRLLEFGKRAGGAADGSDGAGGGGAAPDPGGAARQPQQQGLGAVRLGGFGSWRVGSEEERGAPTLQLPGGGGADGAGGEEELAVDAGAMSLSGAATSDAAPAGVLAWKLAAESDWDLREAAGAAAGPAQRPGADGSFPDAARRRGAEGGGGYRRGFLRDARNPLEADAVLVDEASMVDVRLAHALLSAVRAPSQGRPAPRVMLVGDANQLPPVGPGRVFADIIDSGVARVTRLTEVFRQAAASPIVRNAHLVNEGRIPSDFLQWDAGGGQRAGPERDDLVARLPRSDDPEHPGSCVWVDPPEEEAGVDGVASAILAAVRELGFDPSQELQVLSPMRRGLLGTGTLNLAMRRAVNPPGDGSPVVTHPVSGQEGHFRAGDKVLQRFNDYDRGVINGDVGTVVSVRPSAGKRGPWGGKRRGGAPAGGFDVRVRFDSAGGGGPDAPESLDAEYSGAEVTRHLELAHAMTVHKAQGSEWPVVVLALQTAHYPMLSRGLLYTAVSRAKRLLVVVGSRQAAAIAVGRADDGDRCTGLVQRLRDAARAVDAALDGGDGAAGFAMMAQAGPDEATGAPPPDAAATPRPGGRASPPTAAAVDPWADLGVGDVLPTAQDEGRRPQLVYRSHEASDAAELWDALDIDRMLLDR